MRKRSLIAFFIIFAVGLLFGLTDTHAMPNFARKYGADCTMCHTNIPKLNRLGYEFRLAGYRLPSEIGKDEKTYSLGDFFAARFQQQYRFNKTRPATGPSTSTNQLEFFEFTFYPLTGSWGKHFASIGEFSMAPDDVFEIENAFVRGVYGGENGWFQARVGIMHPFEGFGASDRPLSTIRPLFQRQRTTGSPFIIWNLDEQAAEAGYHLGRTGTSLSARISNGILWKGDGSGAAEPAQGGGLSKTENGNTLGTDRKNYQIFLNQFITRESAVTLHYYRGTVPFVDPAYTGETPVSGAFAQNILETFTRYSAYANFWVLPSKVNLLAGGEMGRDVPDGAVKVTYTNLTNPGRTVAFNSANAGESKGYFGEINFHATSKLALAARYDLFDPSRNVQNNTITAYTGSANYYWTNGLQLIADYQKRNTQVASGRTNDDLYQVRMIFIW